MNTPNIFLLIGATGSGKSFYLKELVEGTSERVAVLQPKFLLEPFDPKVNWDTSDCLVLDGVGGWEPTSFLQGFEQLQKSASSMGKKMLLVLQEKEQIDRLGIDLTSAPAVFDIHGSNYRFVFLCEGQEVPFLNKKFFVALNDKILKWMEPCIKKVENFFTS